MASKQILTLKQVYLTHMIRNIILPAYSLSVFVVVLYVEAKITPIATIDQKESAIRTIGGFSSIIYRNTSLTKKLEEKIE